MELLAAAIVVGQIVDQVIQPRLMGSIVGLQPAWLLIALPIGARVGDLFGFGDLLGLLLAVPVASCVKTLADAAARQMVPWRRNHLGPDAPGDRLDHQLHRVIQILLAGVDLEIRGFRLFVGAGDPGEFLDFTGAGLGIETLGVAGFADARDRRRRRFQ